MLLKKKQVELTMKSHSDKQEFELFETPKALACIMVSLAAVQLYETVLEPSAGRGAIAQYIPMHHIDVIELEPTNRAFLKSEGYNVVGEDFLFFNERYDVIIANPPFENQQDIDHINHMLDLADRCVVALASDAVFKTNKKAVEFRQRVYQLGGTITPLPKNYSKEGICLVTVDNIKKK